MAGLGAASLTPNDILIIGASGDHLEILTGSVTHLKTAIDASLGSISSPTRPQKIIAAAGCGRFKPIRTRKITNMPQRRCIRET